MRWQSPLASLLAVLLFAVGCATVSASSAATRPAATELRLPPVAGLPDSQPIDSISLDLPRQDGRYFPLILRLPADATARLQIDIPADWRPHIDAFREEQTAERCQLLPLSEQPIALKADAPPRLWLRIHSGDKAPGQYAIPLNVRISDAPLPLTVNLHIWPISLANAPRPFHVRGYWSLPSITGGYEVNEQSLRRLEVLLRAYAELGGDVFDWSVNWPQVLPHVKLAGSGQNLAQLAKTAPQQIDLDHLPDLDFSYYDPWFEVARRHGLTRLEAHMPGPDSEGIDWRLLDPAVGKGRVKAGTPQARNVIAWLYRQFKRHLETRGFSGFFCKIDDEIPPEQIPSYLMAAAVGREAGWRPFTTITGMISRTAEHLNAMNPLCEQWQVGFWCDHKKIDFASIDQFFALSRQRYKLEDQQLPLNVKWYEYTNGGAERTWVAKVFGPDSATTLAAAEIDTVAVLQDGQPLFASGDSPWGNKKTGIAFTAGRLNTHLYVSPTDGASPATHRIELKLKLRRPNPAGQVLVSPDPTDEFWFYSGPNRPDLVPYAFAWQCPAMALHYGLDGYGFWAFYWWKVDRVLEIDPKSLQVSISPAYCGFHDGWRDAVLMHELIAKSGRAEYEKLIGSQAEAVLRLAETGSEHARCIVNAADVAAVNSARRLALQALAGAAPAAGGASNRAVAGPLPGQIVIDPDHPQSLKRHGGQHLFICGPGDPENFLYRGQRKADGTRAGDQVELIEKLAKYGGNCIYMQMVRSPGGDTRGDRSHNPFVDSHPAKGLDQRILDQWERWFTLMDKHDILIYLFFYDDGARIWNTGDHVGKEERAFVKAIVRRFKHHRNLIWVIGEESEERYSTARVQAIAEVIRNVDDHGHVIGNHHQSGTVFKAWQPRGALNHFAMQLTATGEAAHAGAIEALAEAAGGYQVIYSESTATPTEVDGMRHHAWDVAMGGVMPMLLGMDIATTPVEALQQWRHLQRFFESTDFCAMAPHDELKHGQTKYVLADPRRSYIAYVDQAGDLGLKNLPAGKCAITWMDCRTGQRIQEQRTLDRSGDALFTRPQSLGSQCAAWIRFPDIKAGGPDTRPAPRQAQVTDGKDAALYYPPPESQGGWRKLQKPEDIRALGGMDPAKLEELKQWLLASDKRDFAAVVIRHGYICLEVERGNSAKTDSRRVASVSKAVCATVLAIASEQSQQGLTPRKMSFDDPAFDFIPWSQPLSDPRKAKITVRQLLNHTSGICPEATGAPNDGKWDYILGHSGDARTAKLAFDPGTACGYSTHALTHASLVCETVTGKRYDQFAIESLFKPLGIEHWWFQYYDGPEKYGKHPSHGLGMPARDLARICYCMLHEGRWNDRQVIPRWFIEQTGGLSHELKTPEMRWKLNPQTFVLGWERPALLTGEGGRSGAGIPADARAKPGSGGQYIAFVPSLDLVITRQTGASGEWQFEEYLRRACAAVLQSR